MPRKKKNVMEMLCDKCKKPQARNEEKSTENWDVYDCNVKCECGGKYTMHMDGKPL